MTSDHEAKVMNHCLQHGITVQTLPSGATRFLGKGVNLLTRDIGSVSIDNLQAYEPRKGHAARNDWDQACAKDYPLQPWQRKVGTPFTSSGH